MCRGREEVPGLTRLVDEPANSGGPPIKEGTMSAENSERELPADESPDVEAHRRHKGFAEDPDAEDDGPDVEAHRRHKGFAEDPDAEDDGPDVEGHIRHKNG
jgi:hypothetical protein